MERKFRLMIFGFLVFGIIGMSQQASALPLPPITVVDTTCDPLFGPSFADELGTTFPADELISVGGGGSAPPPCPSTNSAGPEIVFDMINTVDPPQSFSHVWYVADDGTTITNADGTFNGKEAFLIDSSDTFGGCGINCPLIFESITSDGIWEPGEIWGVTLQDYSNTFGIQHNALGSPGIGFASASFGDGSSGSIIVEAPMEDIAIGGTYIPIDTTALLLAGVQSISMWMIPVVIIGAGIGIFVIKRRN